MTYAPGDSRLADYARAGLLGMTLLGVGFSVYLTFLEPFVIGATCAWCVTSALTMLLLLWLTAPEGWRALQAIRQGQPPVHIQQAPLLEG